MAKKKQDFNITSFYVINYDINHKKFIKYNVIPHFLRVYNELKDKHSNDLPVTYEEFKKWIEKNSMYQFWSRCEYEIILLDWPCEKIKDKWDVHDQIMMNIDTITHIIMNVCQNQ